MNLIPGPFGLLLFDQLEYRYQDGDDLFRWDVEGWYGGDEDRFWFATEGEQALEGPDSGNFELHGYYGRLIAPYWDAQAGLRYDEVWESGERHSRVFAAFGVQGFAPYRFEVSPTLFVSEDGDTSFRFTASKDYRITQRLVAQPRFETEYSFSNVPEFGVGNGFNYVELGVRLRYEFRREFAPYIGIEWEKELGDTADFSRADGEDTDVFNFVAGVRLWF
ncbi:MAG: copper resistance protein B [Verrucomicrobiae bacterium]|nr:copper resistance protein B [Verrucomicrobiae bacterium]